MGFKDLAFFNDALLAKQAWILLHNKESLFYRVFKAKKFPNFLIMEAPECNSGSYAWHSILRGRDVLLKGARWRVDNGELIGMWLDSWLPSLEHPKIMSPMVEGFEENKVADLIDPMSRQWDLGLLQGLFNPNEVNLIRSTPLSSSSCDDKIIWPFNSSRQYSV